MKKFNYRNALGLRIYFILNYNPVHPVNPVRYAVERVTYYE